MTTKIDTISMVSGEDGDQRQFRKQMNKLNLYDQDSEFFDTVDKPQGFKKRRFKELQKFSLEDDFMAPSPTSSQGMKQMKKREQK